jgi:hypothetical protein
MIGGYEEALEREEDNPESSPEVVGIVMKQAVTGHGSNLRESG